MEVKYRPPLDDNEECAYLDANFRTCLNEKSVKDQVPLMRCKPEQIIWFYLECPTKTAIYENSQSLRQAFIQSKIAETDPKASILKKK